MLFLVDIVATDDNEWCIPSNGCKFKLSHTTTTTTIFEYCWHKKERKTEKIDFFPIFLLKRTHTHTHTYMYENKETAFYFIWQFFFITTTRIAKKKTEEAKSQQQMMFSRLKAY